APSSSPSSRNTTPVRPAPSRSFANRDSPPRCCAQGGSCTTGSAQRRRTTSLTTLRSDLSPSAAQRDHRMGQFDAEDVGKFAAAAFLEPETFSGEKIDLECGALTFAEIAQHLSAATGVEVTVKHRTQEETEAVKGPVLMEISIMAPRRGSLAIRRSW
ncbi:hypothetical protein C8J57DRAFT_1371525, partial [Mycena rebaudengoi]